MLKQTKEIEEKRKKMEQERQAQNNNPSGEQIILQEPGKPPVALKSQDVIRLINGLREELKKLRTKNDELIKINETMLQKNNGINSTKIQDLEKENQILKDKLKTYESNNIETTT